MVEKDGGGMVIQKGNKEERMSEKRREDKEIMVKEIMNE